MFTIQISRPMLAAVSRFMAKQDIRYYLNGVKVEVYANVAYVVATDGHTMAIGRIERESGLLMEGQGEIILPAESVEKIKATGNNGLPIILSVEDPQESGDKRQWFTLNDCGTKTTQQAIDGQFPDWRKVIPYKPSGEVAYYNPEYLMRCQKAAKDLGSKKGYFELAYNGNSGALVTFTESVMAVLMPMRQDTAERPEWAGECPDNVGRECDLDKAWDSAIAEQAIESEIAA